MVTLRTVAECLEDPGCGLDFHSSPLFHINKSHVASMCFDICVVEAPSLTSPLSLPCANRHIQNLGLGYLEITAWSSSETDLWP